jgi:hypothetical protein
MELAAHIARICKIKSIEVANHSRGGRAYRRSRRIKIRPVKSEITYAIALHEIGHILGKRQNGTRLDKEVGAWEWALEHALRWTLPMSRTMQRCLRAYLAKVERSPHMKQAAPDHPVHALAAQ